MAIELCTHTPGQEAPEYLPLKRRMIGAGLFGCSQRGFNIAMGPLVGLRRRVEDALARIDPDALAWEVPTLIRSDWVHWKAWQDPAEDEWCFEQPGGNVLTPRPLLHLANRLSHHPVPEGTWLLSGDCFRNEDPDRTLPLLRQRSFRMLELVHLQDPAGNGDWPRRVLDHLWELFVKLDLPVTMVEVPATGRGHPDIEVRLQLRAAEQVSLVRSWELPMPLREAYRLGDRRIWTIGAGPERICLGIMARWGVDTSDWPKF